MGKSALKERKPGEPLANPQHELFCRLYATDREFMGNGTRTYQEVYSQDRDDIKSYNTARANSAELLAKTNIIQRVNELLSDEGFNDENVTKQHLFLINQDSELTVKKGAVEMYYKLKKKLEDKQQIDQTVTIRWQ